MVNRMPTVFLMGGNLASRWEKYQREATMQDTFDDYAHGNLNVDD